MRTRVIPDPNETKPEPGPKANEMRARILKPGQKIEGLPASVPATAQPGTYRVTHGRLCFGHVDGDSIYADPGAIVELTAEEAGRMLASGVVERAA